MSKSTEFIKYLEIIIEDGFATKAETMAATLLRQQDEALKLALESLLVFKSCALPVPTVFDERGHIWVQSYLDQALPIADVAITKLKELT